jgi:hypothetical protein
MTLNDIEEMDTEFLDVQTVANYYNMPSMPQCIRESIRNGVPWGYVLGKSKFIIPRRAFVNYHKNGSAVIMG